MLPTQIVMWLSYLCKLRRVLAVVVRLAGLEREIIVSTGLQLHTSGLHLRQPHTPLPVTQQQEKQVIYFRTGE